jgi:predicted CoA-binding protein
MKQTLVLGASPNENRFSYKAVVLLSEYGHKVLPFGNKKGRIKEHEILSQINPAEKVHTITMYLGAERQKAYYDFILSIKPKRIIFNPGAENSELANLAAEQGIEVVENCTLVMLQQGIY